jgi:hypothetical protein
MNRPGMSGDSIRWILHSQAPKTFGLPEPVQARHRQHARLLHRVTGQVLRHQKSGSHRQRGRPHDEFAERVPLAATCSLHQRSIGPPVEALRVHIP